MIIDRVMQHPDTPRMAFIHQLAQFIRGAVAVFDGVDAVLAVAPYGVAGKFVHRHQFNRVDAQFHQIIQFFDERFERAPLLLAGKGWIAWLRVEVAHMQFIDNQLVAGGQRDIIMFPLVSRQDTFAALHPRNGTLTPVIQCKLDRFRVGNADLLAGGEWAYRHHFKLVLIFTIRQRHFHPPGAAFVALHRDGLPVVPTAQQGDGFVIRR